MNTMSAFRFVIKLIFRVLCMIFLVQSFACMTPLKEITYMHGSNPGTASNQNKCCKEYTFRPGDLLYINIIGEDPENTAFLNLAQGVSYVSNSLNIDFVTYQVDMNGVINFPHFGEIRVAGLNAGEIRTMLQEKVDLILENTSVFVKHVNRSVTILGEVKNPGQHMMLNDRITVFEALGLAGDINEYGNRKSVKIVRETPALKITEQLDLTDPGVIHSKFYYIYPRDLIYVEPTSKVYGFKTMPFGTGFTIIFSSISTTLLLLNFLK